ncbi:TIGR04076 family protein [Archaeoglobus neptunius]|uniref:TIGR04076 family protein n=1 Tax=Archaeoglobus neptunius TaxID=2798580 RepID=UPI0019288E40
MRAKIEVVEVSGKCAAGYKVGDTFYLRDFLIEADIPVCIHAIYSVGHVAYTLTHAGKFRTEGEIFLSCPDPGKPHGEGKVTFRIEVSE